MVTIYASSFFSIIEQHLPDAHGYADDHQLYLAFRPDSSISQESAVEAIQYCVKDVRQWMLSNELKINDSKTEFLLLGSRQQLEKVDIP